MVIQLFHCCLYKINRGKEEVTCQDKTMMKRKVCKGQRWVLEQDSSLVLNLTREV
jgi:hypothetical protein